MLKQPLSHAPVQTLGECWDNLFNCLRTCQTWSEEYKGHQQTNTVTKSKHGQIPLFILDYVSEKVMWYISCCFVLPALDSCNFGVLSLFIYLVCDNFKTWHPIGFKTLGVFASVSRTSLILPKVMKTARAFYVFCLEGLTRGSAGLWQSISDACQLVDLAPFGRCLPSYLVHGIAQPLLLHGVAAR